MRKLEDIVERVIKNIIYLLKLIANTLIKSKIITINIFQKCNFKFINRKSY